MSLFKHVEGAGVGTKQVRGEHLQDWHVIAKRLYFEEGKGVTEIAKYLFPELPKEKAYNKVWSYLKIQPQRRGSVEVEIQPKPEKPEKPKKIEVVRNYEPTTVQSSWHRESIIRFAIVSDTHINSKFTQLTYLHNFYDLVAKRGITNVYHVGDVDEGEQMRIGHQYELYLQGADDHLDEIVKNYPKRDGIVTSYITGNHDASLMKRSGFSIGKALARERNDMIYLGQDCATVMLTPKCSMLLSHPWDGSAYAISYKSQKMMDAISGGEKPNILLIGHFHKAEYLFYRNIHCLQAGTFQAQTPFMRGKSLAAMMGGWIVEVEVGSNGEILRFVSEWIPYYQAIKDDWMNWRG